MSERLLPNAAYRLPSAPLRRTRSVRRPRPRGEPRHPPGGTGQWSAVRAAPPRPLHPGSGRMDPAHRVFPECPAQRPPARGWVSHGHPGRSEVQCRTLLQKPSPPSKPAWQRGWVRSGTACGLKRAPRSLWTALCWWWKSRGPLQLSGSSATIAATWKKWLPKPLAARRCASRWWSHRKARPLPRQPQAPAQRAAQPVRARALVLPPRKQIHLPADRAAPPLRGAALRTL